MKPNIDSTGRAARGGMAILFLLLGGVLLAHNVILAAVFLLIGLFCAYEAWRGWCAIRACGIRTPF